MKPVTELMSFLASLLPPLRSARQFGAVLNLEVAQDITKEVVAKADQLSAVAYTAQQADLEAAQLIGVITADGHLTDDELPLLTRALRHINRSAGHDHTLSTELSA